MLITTNVLNELLILNHQLKYFSKSFDFYTVKVLKNNVCVIKTF
jgi:hypothetical protein